MSDPRGKFEGLICARREREDGKAHASEPLRSSLRVRLCQRDGGRRKVLPQSLLRHDLDSRAELA